MTDYTLIEKCVMYFFTYLFAPPVLIITKPLGIIFDFITIHSPNLFKTQNTVERHARKVENVQKQVLI